MSDTTKGVLLAVGVLLLACMGCCGLMRTYSEVKQFEFERAARRLGFEPTLDGITEYIKESVEIGMLRDEVEQILGDIAPLRIERGELNEESKAGWGSIACDRIWLKLGPLPGDSPKIYACYDKEGGLVKMNFAGSDAPPLDIYAPRQE